LGPIVSAEPDFIVPSLPQAWGPSGPRWRLRATGLPPAQLAIKIEKSKNSFRATIAASTGRERQWASIIAEVQARGQSCRRAWSGDPGGHGRPKDPIPSRLYRGRPPERGRRTDPPFPETWIFRANPLGTSWWERGPACGRSGKGVVTAPYFLFTMPEANGQSASLQKIGRRGDRDTTRAHRGGLVLSEREMAAFYISPKADWSRTGKHRPPVRKRPVVGRPTQCRTNGIRRRETAVQSPFTDPRPPTGGRLGARGWLGAPFQPLNQIRHVLPRTTWCMLERGAEFAMLTSPVCARALAGNTKCAVSKVYKLILNLCGRRMPVFRFGPGRLGAVYPQLPG